MMKHILTALTIVIFQIFFNPSALAARFNIVDDPQKSTITSFGELDQVTQPMWDAKSIVSPEVFIDEDMKILISEYEEVVNLIKQKQFKQADNKINVLIKQTPDNPHLYNLQGLNLQAQINIKEGNKELARQSFQKAVQLNPDNSLANIGLAKLAIFDKQLNEAKNYTDKALIINDKSVIAYMLLAEIAYKRGDNQEIEQILLIGHNKVRGDINAETQIIAALNRFYLNQKQPDKTLHLSQELVDHYPDSPLALAILANAQIANKQKNSAELTLQKLTMLDKKHTKHFILLAYFLSKYPDRENEVLKLLDEAFEINPANPQVLVLKTVYLVNQKNYQHAQDTANKIDKLFPRMMIGMELKGNIYSAEKKFDQAFEAYQQVYQFKHDIKVLLKMTNILIVQGKQTSAINILKRESGKNNKHIDFKLASIYLQQNNYKQAEKYYNLVLAEQPDSLPTLNNLAWIYAQQNNPEAIKLAEKAYSIAPKSAIVADTYGYILIKNSEEKKGLKILQEAVKASPQSGNIQFHLAEAYSLSGNKQKAITILETLTKGVTSFSDKENAIKLLKKLKHQ